MVVMALAGTMLCSSLTSSASSGTYNGSKYTGNTYATKSSVYATLTYAKYAELEVCATVTYVNESNKNKNIRYKAYGYSEEAKSIVSETWNAGSGYYATSVNTWGKINGVKLYTETVTLN